MNIIIFCLTILVIYAIMVKAYKIYLEVDENEKNEDLDNGVNSEMKDRMRAIQTTERQYDEIIQFKKDHKGNLVQKEEVIKKFINKENKWIK